jgi:hypothetical protein
VFYNREDNVILEIKPSTNLNPEVKTVKLAEDEKFCGFEAHHNSNVVYGFGVKIAKGVVKKGGDSLNQGSFGSFLNLDANATKSTVNAKAEIRETEFIGKTNR